MTDTQIINRPLGVKIIYWYTIVGIGLLIGVTAVLAAVSPASLVVLRMGIFDDVALIVTSALSLYAAICLYNLQRKAVELFAAVFVLGELAVLVDYVLAHGGYTILQLVSMLITASLVNVIILCYSYRLLRKGILT